jgi:DNA repair exonuclease SbcCD ATPase subunit
MIADLKIGRLRAHHALSYKDLDVNFADQGITLISGKNGHGKSTLFDLLMYPLYGCTSKKDQTSSTRIVSLHYPNGFEISLDFEANDIPYNVHHSRNPSPTIAFTSNGESLNVKNKRQVIADTQKLVAQKTGFTQEEFSSIVYLNQRYTSKLIDGTASEKQSAIMGYFGLQQLDEVLTVLKATSATRKVDFAKEKKSHDDIIAMTRSDIADIESKLNPQGLMPTLASSMQSMMVERDGYARMISAYELTRKHRKTLKTLPEELQALSVDDLISLLKSAKERDDQANKYNTYRKAKDDRDALIASYPHLADMPQNVEDLVDDYVHDKALYAKYAELKKDPNYKYVQNLSTKDAADIVARLTYREEKSRASIKQFAAIGASCPCCTQAVPAELLESLKTQEKSQLKKVQEYLLLAKKNLKLRNDIDAIENKYRREPHEYPESAIMQLYESSLMSWLRYRSLSDQVATHKAQGFHKSPVDMPATSDIEACLSIKKSLALIEGKAPITKEIYEQAMVTRDHLTVEINKSQEIITQNEIHQKSLDKLRARLEETERKLASLESYATTQRISSVLFDSVKELRALKLHKAVSILGDTLPHYLDRVFYDEDIMVKVEEKETSCDLLFIKHGKTIPLSAISPGESRKLGLAILFALSKTVAKKCNILIFDEPYSNVDASSRKACFDLLKEASRNVSSLFVISHDVDVQSKYFDQRWNVTQDDGKTSVLHMTQE